MEGASSPLIKFDFYLMQKNLNIVLGVLIILSCFKCKESEIHIDLTKLTSEELIQRAKDNNWPDVTKVTYIMDGDTITIDSVARLDYNEIAFDDYVNAEGEVVLAVVRPATNLDLEVREKMNEVAYVESLDGQLDAIEIESQYLDQARKLTIYKPKHDSISDIYFYMTDGIVVKDIAESINKLIQEDIIIPINLIGINADYGDRYKEYIKQDEDALHFDNHLIFFLNEVPALVEEKRDDASINRYLFGFSNGADFCNYIGVNHPNWARKIVAMSGVAYFPQDLIPRTNEDIAYPEFILSSGVYEELSNRNHNFKSELELIGAEVTYTEHPGGHEYDIWKERLLDFIKEEFSLSG